MSIKLVREEFECGHQKPQCFRPQLLGCLAELGNDPDKKFLRNLEGGDTIGYKSDAGTSLDVFHGKTKQRVYDEQRLFLGNYKTVLGKEEDLQKPYAEIRMDVLYRDLSPSLN